MTTREFISEKDLATRWSVSYRTLQDWRKSGFLPYTQLRGCIRYSMDVIKAFEAMHTHPATGQLMLSEAATSDAIKKAM